MQHSAFDNDNFGNVAVAADNRLGGNMPCPFFIFVV